MRISHIEVGECASNPKVWVRNKFTTPAHGYKMGYERVLRLAIAHLHKSNPDSARDYLESAIRRHNFKDRSRVSRLERQLEMYLKWVQSSGVVVADSNVRLLDTSIDRYLQLAGTISRLDLMPHGYRSIILGSPPPNWQVQLRMPLIQSVLADMYRRPVEEISVGFQMLDASALESICYSIVRIRKARAEFAVLGERVKSFAKAYLPKTP